MRRIISAVTAKKKTLLVWNIIYKKIENDTFDYDMYDIYNIKSYILSKLRVNKKITPRQYKLIENNAYCPLCAYFSKSNGNPYGKFGACIDTKYSCPLLHCVDDSSTYRIFYKSLGKNKEDDLRRVKEIINAIESWRVSK